jgi:hypothetical protein
MILDVGAIVPRRDRSRGVCFELDVASASVLRSGRSRAVPKGCLYIGGYERLRRSRVALAAKRAGNVRRSKPAAIRWRDGPQLGQEVHLGLHAYGSCVDGAVAAVRSRPERAVAAD